MLKINNLLSVVLFLFIPQTNLFSGLPYLSNLNATKDSPIFTTYAAAMKRSEFTLDEGFHFLFYDPERGADFITDTAGDWCIGFEKNGKFVYKLKDMAGEIVITKSYPDLVEYHYYPFKELRADVTFLVYGSKTAIQDITLTNTGKEKIDVKIYPFLNNRYRTYDQIRLYPEKNLITFSHQELPDTWMLDHKIPHFDVVYDIFAFSEPADRMLNFTIFDDEKPHPPHRVCLDKKQTYLVQGRMFHENKERCHHHNPKPRYMVILNNDPTRIITENCPRWGSSEENINRYGFYSTELGNFGNIKSQDKYKIILMCEESQKYGVTIGTVQDISKIDRERKDVTFRKTDILPPPGNIYKKILNGNREIVLSWERVDKNKKYNLYRMDYLNSGFYKLIAAGIDTNYHDTIDCKIYSYVVAAVDSLGNLGMISEPVTSTPETSFMRYICSHEQSEKTDSFARVVAAEKNVRLSPGEKRHFRIIRSFYSNKNESKMSENQIARLMKEDLRKYITINEKLFSKIPELCFDNPDKEMLYWMSFNLMRQLMLPPEGRCGYNYYLFSREPTWGWGHGGQVFHESLTMLAYAYMDPVSAMNSQRVFMERQHENGYINYRTGPYLDETIFTRGQFTSSAPWYAWENWEIFKITKDKRFLEEMYTSSTLFYKYYTSSRDRDEDGLCEWGAHAVLESVRDAYVAVWDEVGWPSLFEGLDLNSMLVNEAQSLARMARELGRDKDAKRWESEAESRKEKINKTMWDEKNGFYYHVDMKDNDFTYKNNNDLKRDEIIGFLPLWAAIATPEMAERLIDKLTDPEKFWRRYGIPSLAADDPYYNPKGYWNGPVWVEWNALIVHGLINYGYNDLAAEITDRVAKNMIAQLKKDHNFWEFYSPDHQWAGYHKSYIWAGIIARMMIDCNEGRRINFKE